jgi:hypothetical protein
VCYRLIGTGSNSIATGGTSTSTSSTGTGTSTSTALVFRTGTASTSAVVQVAHWYQLVVLYYQDISTTGTSPH